MQFQKICLILFSTISFIKLHPFEQGCEQLPPGVPHQVPLQGLQEGRQGNRKEDTRTRFGFDLIFAFLFYFLTVQHCSLRLLVVRLVKNQYQAITLLIFMQDMVGLVPDGLERYNIFLNSSVPFPRSTVCFSLLVSVLGVVKIFFLKNMMTILIKELKWYVRCLFPKKCH